MYIENGISIYDFATTISEGVDLVTPGLDCHHKMVACIAYNIARVFYNESKRSQRLQKFL